MSYRGVEDLLDDAMHSNGRLWGLSMPFGALWGAFGALWDATLEEGWHHTGTPGNDYTM